MIRGSELSYDSKTIITVICLVTVYPVGLVLMFAWMKWKAWVKVLISLPLVLAFFLPLLMIVMMSLLVLRWDGNFSGSEIIRERYKVVEVMPTEIVSPTVTVKPTMRVVK